MGFDEVFEERYAVIGMLHLAGKDPVSRACEEALILAQEGVHGCIVENYHASATVLEAVLQALDDAALDIAIGVNVLPNEFEQAFELVRDSSASIIQLDHVAGEYQRASLDVDAYQRARSGNPHVVVLGGVWPKYYSPIEGSSLEDALKIGATRADGIVVTGAGTGKETPLEKIKRFHDVLRSTPLIVGAGVTPPSITEHFEYARGAIVGSYFKDGDTRKKVQRENVRRLMERVRDCVDAHR